MNMKSHRFRMARVNLGRKSLGVEALLLAKSLRDSLRRLALMTVNTRYTNTANIIR